MASNSKRRLFEVAMVDTLRSRLKEMEQEAPPPSKSLTRTAIIKQLRPQIEALYSRGYTASQVVERLKNEGLSVSVGLLKVETKRPAVNKGTNSVTNTATSDTTTDVTSNAVSRATSRATSTATRNAARVSTSDAASQMTVRANSGAIETAQSDPSKPLFDESTNVPAHHITGGTGKLNADASKTETQKGREPQGKPIIRSSGFEIRPDNPNI